MDDVVRWIEIKPSHTFMDFNNIIQEAIGFDNKELASFFVSDDRWRKISEVKKAKPIGDADLTGNANAPLMQDTKIRSCVNDPPSTVHLHFRLLDPVDPFVRTHQH